MGDEFICPGCGADLHIVAKAVIPDEQKMVMCITHDGLGFSAKALGSAITHMDKLLREVAKDVGGKVSVLIDGIKHENKTVEITFVIAEVSKP